MRLSMMSAMRLDAGPFGPSRSSTRAARATPREAAASGVRRDRDDGWRDVLREILGQKPLRVLDVGSGDGDATLLLDDLGHYPHGVDIEPDAVRRARSRADARCAVAEFRIGDAENLEFPARSFDAVHARDLLASLAHPDWALAEWYRVLRPGGIAVLAQTGPSAASADILRCAGFHDVAEREIVSTSRPAERTRWFHAFTPSVRSRCSIAWGRRD